MEHKGTVRLETERLVLRPFTRDDAQAIFDNWASDPEVTKYLAWPTHTSVDVSRQIAEMWEAGNSDPKTYQWAFTLKGEDVPFGSISVVHMNEDIGEVEIGYCIGRAYWHKGYSSEALAAVMKFMFEEVGAQRVQARHDPRNANSGRVMKHCGMKYEGTHRRADRNNQGVVDAVYYAMLREEYEAEKAQ